jgi:phosphate transport system protein
MTEKHLSSGFDQELNTVSRLVMELGGLVETQVAAVLDALVALDPKAAEEIIATEKRVNQLEMNLDFEAIATIARRQPTARDLRLLIAVAKATTDLERIGDEAETIAFSILNLVKLKTEGTEHLYKLKSFGERAAELLRRALDAFARLDDREAASLVEHENVVSDEVEAWLPSLKEAMMREPANVEGGLEMLSIARCIERVQDHAVNVAEFTIYVVQGADIRHRHHFGMPGISR